MNKPFNPQKRIVSKNTKSDLFNNTANIDYSKINLNLPIYGDDNSDNQYGLLKTISYNEIPSIIDSNLTGDDVKSLKDKLINWIKLTNDDSDINNCVTVDAFCKLTTQITKLLNINLTDNINLVINFIDTEITGENKKYIDLNNTNHVTFYFQAFKKYANKTTLDYSYFLDKLNKFTIKCYAPGLSKLIEIPSKYAPTIQVIDLSLGKFSFDLDILSLQSYPYDYYTVVLTYEDEYYENSINASINVYPRHTFLIAELQEYNNEYYISNIYENNLIIKTNSENLTKSRLLVPLYNLQPILNSIPDNDIEANGEIVTVKLIENPLTDSKLLNYSSIKAYNIVFTLPKFIINLNNTISNINPNINTTQLSVTYSTTGSTIDSPSKVLLITKINNLLFTNNYKDDYCKSISPVKLLVIGSNKLTFLQIIFKATGINNYKLGINKSNNYNILNCDKNNKLGSTYSSSSSSNDITLKLENTDSNLNNYLILSNDTDLNSLKDLNNPYLGLIDKLRNDTSIENKEYLIINIVLEPAYFKCYYYEFLNTTKNNPFWDNNDISIEINKTVLENYPIYFRLWEKTFKFKEKNKVWGWFGDIALITDADKIKLISKDSFIYPNKINITNPIYMLDIVYLTKEGGYLYLNLDELVTISSLLIKELSLGLTAFKLNVNWEILNQSINKDFRLKLTFTAPNATGTTLKNYADPKINNKINKTTIEIYYGNELESDSEE